MPKIIIEAIGISKTFDLNGSRIEVLRNVDLTLTESESVAIIGPSGSGKSTLLHIIGLLERASAGQVKFDGSFLDDIGEQQRAALRLKSIGFIFQFHHLLPEFSAVENVMIPALMNGLDKSTARERASDLLQQVGLEHRTIHRPGELSGGERQRVALARALVNNPRLILADEPTGNLDQESSLQMQDLLWSVAANHHAGLIVATHNHEMAKAAKRILELRDGRLSGVVLHA
ncbi:MAG: ABC transporter ATP-binding protein [Calditrichaeota bacterium]|nr:ABC transporter ATP-binding protein [Calditrichota bacterium]